uniref:Uncharacterized protein n=1 Tax=Pyrodinium bahamense TaxID=73915 RepID=A0A7S0B641_9DINO
MEASGLQRKQHQRCSEPLESEEQRLTEGTQSEETPEDITRWLQAELVARKGRKHPKARAALTKELARLKKGGDLDQAFRATFEDNFGECLAKWEHSSHDQNLSTVPPHQSFPSLVLVLEQRYGASRLTPPPSPAKLGFQMLSHATDNPRERWNVFIEARRVLLQAIRIEDAKFAATVPRRTHRPRLTWPLSTQEAADRLSALWRGVRTRRQLRRQHGNAVADLLLAEVRRREAVEYQRTAWRQQICTVLQEALRPCSWRGGSRLAGLRRVVLWEHIFAFLRPLGVREDVHNTVAVVAEQLLEHARAHSHLVHAVVVAHGWHLLSRARYSPTAREKEDALRALSACAAPGRGKADGRAPPAAVAEAVAAARAETQARAAECTEAGAAFLAVREWRLAAESLDEAARVAGTVPELLQRAGLCPAGPREAASAEAARRHAARAASAWLLAAKRAGCAGRQGQEALQCAAAALARAGRACDAACCAARAGQMRLALKHLLPCADDRRAAPLGLLCAGLLGELGAVKAGSF